MKKSNIIIIIVIAACALAITGAIIASRFVITKDDRPAGSADDGTVVFASTEMVTEAIDTEHFSLLQTSGTWEIAVEHGDTCRVEVSAPNNIHEYLDIGAEEGELRFSMKSSMRYRGSYKPVVVVTMPLLEGIDSSGQLELTFDGFSGETLSLNTSGVATVEGKDSSFGLLVIEASGVSNLDPETVYAESARIDLGGVGNAVLNLGGGDFTGSLGGVYQLTYSGTPSSVDIDTGGLSSLSREKG